MALYMFSLIELSVHEPSKLEAPIASNTGLYKKTNESYSSLRILTQSATQNFLYIFCCHETVFSLYPPFTNFEKHKISHCTNVLLQSIFNWFFSYFKNLFKWIVFYNNTINIHCEKCLFQQAIYQHWSTSRKSMLGSQ